MRRNGHRVAAAALIVAAAGMAAAAGEQGSAVRMVTDKTGSSVVAAPGFAFGGGAAGADDVVWSVNDPVAIAESVALASGADFAWVGWTLNSERLEGFEVPGDATPDFVFADVDPNSPSIVAAADDADLVVYLDGVYGTGPFRVLAFTSGSTEPLWAHDVDPFYTGAAPNALAVSDDGSVVVAYFTSYDIDLQVANNGLLIFDGATGELTGEFKASGFGGNVDLTDDGSLALLTQSATARVIDTATATERYSAAGNGGGSTWFRISGNGDTIAIGGFDLRVHTRSGETWSHAWTYPAATSWFGATAVSADGKTIGSTAHNYSGYLQTTTRIWDVSSSTPLGTYVTNGTGSFQDAVAEAAMSDDGQVFAAATWGTQNNAHPEVMIFDRGANLIGGIDLPGSAFAVDISPDGRYVLGGGKHVHANTFGNGGDVVLFDTGIGAGCYPDFDGNDVLNLFDFLAYTNAFNAGDPSADCDGSGVLNLFDFLCFTNAFNAGC